MSIFAKQHTHCSHEEQGTCRKGKIQHVISMCQLPIVGLKEKLYGTVICIGICIYFGSVMLCYLLQNNNYNGCANV